MRKNSPKNVYKALNLPQSKISKKNHTIKIFSQYALAFELLQPTTLILQFKITLWENIFCYNWCY